ncbi:MAG: hypothetical protein F6K11_37200, partial [Leptolyngbya sp. SIO3F4]|nr:hypothetical protein [Leptolyngbya sp. SIO3F4]
CFYLTAKDTQLDAVTTTAISSNYIQQALPSLQTGLNRVMILDCMWGALPAKRSNAQSVVVEPDCCLSAARLADCNCALFTALGSNANPWPMSDAGLSLYTQNLVEGITTGLADIDADGDISIGDLQTYIAQNLGETDAGLFPIALLPSKDITITNAGVEVDNSNTENVLKAPILAVKPYSPEREYRRSVEEYAHHGQISPAGRNILEFLRYQLGLTLHQSQTIEADVMAPFTNYQESCDRYRQAFIAALELEAPLGKPLRKWLRHLQSELSLSYDDVSTIEAQILAKHESYSTLQALPQWLTPANRPKLPAHYQNGQVDKKQYIN